MTSALRIAATWLLTLSLTACSEQTQREAGEAVDQTGKALGSAAKDAANVTEGAIEGASKALKENETKPDVDVELEE